MEAYKVGVTIAMSSNAAQVLGAISKQLLGIHGHIGKINGQLSRMGLAIGGVAAIMGGEKILKGYAKLVEHGEKLVHYQTQLRAAGYDNQKIAEATARAYKTGHDVMGSRVAESLRDIHHLADITGDIDEAIGLSGTFAQVKSVLSSLKDDKMRAKFEGDELQTYNFARALEVMGETTQGPAVINDWVGKMTDSMIAMRGLVDVTKFYQAVNMSGGTSMNWSQDFVTKKLPFLIQEMNAGAVGNALYMAQRAIVQGGVTKGAAEGMVKYGLLDGPQDYLTDNSKRFLGVKNSAVKGADVAAVDMDRWVREYLLPHFASHGVDINNAAQVAAATGEIARNKNFFRLISTLAIQQPQLDKEVKNVERVAETGGGRFLQDEIKKDFWAKWDNLLTTLGSPQVGPAYEWVKRITAAFNDLTVSLGTLNPSTLELIGTAIAGIGGTLVTGGVIAMLGAVDTQKQLAEALRLVRAKLLVVQPVRYGDLRAC
jgi:hypothetical protein